MRRLSPSSFRSAWIPVALLLICAGGEAWAGRVLVVASKSMHHHAQTIDALREHSRAHIDAVDIAEHPLAGDDYQFVVALGAEALGYVAALRPRQPYLAALVSRRGYDQVFADASLPVPAATLLNNQPLRRNLTLARRLLPSLTRIGVLVDADNPVELPHVAGMELIERRLKADENVVTALKSLLREVDALLAVPDATTFNRKSIHGVLLSAYRHGKPVIGFSRPLVKAGALFSAYSSPDLLGAQLAELLRDVNDNKIQTPALVYPSHFRVAVNHGIARILGVSSNLSGIEDRVFVDAELEP